MRAEQCKVDLTARDKMKWQMQENKTRKKAVEICVQRDKWGGLNGERVTHLQEQAEEGASGVAQDGREVDVG